MSGEAFSYVEWRRETIQCQQGILSIMVGRTRKRGNREPNGRLQREKPLTKLQVAQQMPHRRGLPIELVEHERAESQFGRLSLTKKPGSGNEYVISPEQYQAGVQWRKTVMNYRAVLHAPNEFPRSIAGSLVGGGGGSRFMSDEEAHRRKIAYNEAYEAVEGAVGRHCMITLNDATVHERFVEPSRMPQLWAALDVLVGLAYQGRRRAG